MLHYYDVQAQPSSATDLTYAATVSNNPYNSQIFGTSTSFTHLIPPNTELIVSPDSSYFSTYSNTSFPLYSQPFNAYNNVVNNNYSTMFPQKPVKDDYNNSFDSLENIQEDKENIPEMSTRDLSTNSDKNSFFTSKAVPKTNSAVLSDSAKIRKQQNNKVPLGTNSSNNFADLDDLDKIRYRERREKNNAAAKQSRSKRRERENILKLRVETLESENERLKKEILELRLKLSEKNFVPYK